MKLEERVKEEENFYRLCAEILGTEHQYRDGVPRPKVDREGKSYIPSSRSTRWGGREPGNGRFPGFGSIRLHWPDLVLIRLNRPKKIYANITGRDEALQYLKQEVNKNE